MGEALFRCRLSAPAAPLSHVWEHTVGSCHAPLALRADWQAHLARCHRELGFRHVRFHGLLSDDLGTLVRHHSQLIYSFFNADRILDFLLSIGMRPFVELSFMPAALASGGAAVFSYRGNVTPPADYRAWARRQAGGRPLLYTEWNASSNPRYPRQDEPYAAAFAAKSALEASDFVEAYSFWTFTDIFEENYFPSVPFHGGFGLLNLHGIPKPTYRAFELLHRLGEERLPVEGSHETVDVWAVRRGTALTVLLTNHALPRQPLAAQRVRIELTDAPPPRAVTLERIDDDHANAKAAWLAMGRPEYLDDAQLENLQEASRLVAGPFPCAYEGRTIRLDVDLPPHAVAAVTIKS